MAEVKQFARFEIAPTWLIPLGLIGLLWVLHMGTLGAMPPDTEDKGKLCLGIAGHVWPSAAIWHLELGIFAVQSAALVALFAARRRNWILALAIVVAPLFVPSFFIVQCGRIVH